MVHVPIAMLKKIPSLKDNSSFHTDLQYKCEFFPLARQTKRPFPSSSSRCLESFESIHMDVWRPYRTTAVSGMRFFLTLVDDYTRWTWIFLMKLKSDVPVLLRDFIAMIHTRFNKKIKMFRSDNGGKFFNSTCKELFQSQGILHQISCPYTPLQNGVVERRHRHILETARAIRFQGHLPTIYWGHCIQAVVNIINRVPSTVL